MKSSDVHRRSPPASGGRRSATVCSSITTRTPRTALSPPRTPCGQRLTHASRRRSPGTKSTTAIRRTSRSLPCRRASRSSATCTRKSIEQAGSLEALLELFERQGLGDAPWPPHYRKQAAEPARVQPSKRKSSKRKSTKPLIEIGRARRKEDALAGLERWKARHPQAAAHLQPADMLVDSMRGRSSTWTRIRINLEHVPEELRPAQEPLDPDEKIFSSS